jgi:phage gp46-like protein
MSDVRIVSRLDPITSTTADWSMLSTGVLDETQELANYVKVALMTDRLSDPDEIRPDLDSDDRHGWWGDWQAQEIWNGWPIGCKNWLLLRAKINDYPSMEGDTVFRAENYTREALQPLVEMRICTAIDVHAYRVGRERIDVRIICYRGNQPEVALLFQNLWEQLIITPVNSPYGTI